MKNLKRMLAVILMFGIVSLNVTAFAVDSNVTVINHIDQDIYDMINDYYSGKFTETVSEKTSVSPRELFQNQNVVSVKNGDPISEVDLYNIKEVDGAANTYEATRVALYTLEQENQTQDQGVVIFTRIVYQEMNVGNTRPAVRLLTVKGGVVQESQDFYCDKIWLRYRCFGVAYDSSGNLVNMTYGNEISYQGPYTGIGGVTYQISGPSEDYYYDMNYPSSFVAGLTQGQIYYKHGSWYNNLIECTSSITG